MVFPGTDQIRIQAAEIIRIGGVIAFRTDTFYGLGADPLNQSAVTRIKQLKGREESKPILILIADDWNVDRYISERSVLFDRVCACHWPGPLTVVGKAREELPVELTAGSGTIGIRLPDDDHVRDLVRVCGGALTATSANIAGRPPACSARDVESYFAAAIDLIIDDGDCEANEPSTVLDLSGPEPKIVRAGALARDQLQQTFAELGVSLR